MLSGADDGRSEPELAIAIAWQRHFDPADAREAQVLVRLTIATRGGQVVEEGPRRWRAGPPAGDYPVAATAQAPPAFELASSAS
jgi:hypothetical protein